MLDPVVVEAQLTAYYDQEGDGRAARPLDPRRLAARSSLLASLVDGPRRVLEIGSGPGRDAQAFLDAGHVYVAVDLSLEHLRRCHDLSSAAVRASVRSLPFRTSSFDVIWTMSTLMHVPNIAIERALEELRRVLVPGGVATIGVWGGPDIEDAGVDDASATAPPRLFSRRSNATWRSLLARIGEVRTFESWGEDDFPYQSAVVVRDTIERAVQR